MLSGITLEPKGRPVGRFDRSVQLAKASWNVLRGDKQLIWLPVLSGLTTLIVMVTFLLPAAIVAHDADTGGYSAKPIDWVLGAIGYLVLAYVVVFFNAALVWAADRRLRGESVTVGEAIHFSASRTHVLLPWAIVSATVSIAIRLIEERAGIVGRIVGLIAGVAWALVTFLVLPVLVVEGLGPIAAVKRSGSLFKRTWGEQVISNAGIGLISLVAILIGAVPAALLFLIGGPIAIAGIVAFVAWVIAVTLVSSALTGILQTALYRFATDGEVPGFDTDGLRGAFQPRNKRGWLN
jgi:uncharacterized protein DUF6159